MLKILADENIPLLDKYFAPLGKLTRCAGREIKALDLKDIDILLVRSVTPIGSQLLDASPVQFVGSATVGVDHIDFSFLKRRQISFAHAPKASSHSVVDYVISVLVSCAWPNLSALAKKTVGIVGMGTIGGLLYQRLQQMGVPCLYCDPFKKVAPSFSPVTLEEILHNADIISLHLPLTHTSKAPTYHLLGAKELGLLKQNALLINTSRGAVIDNEKLKRLLSARTDLSIILDVWEHEPCIDPELLTRMCLATPHIAGYSIDAKRRGAFNLYTALCRHLQRKVTVEPPDIHAGITPTKLKLHSTSCPFALLQEAVERCYAVRKDDIRLHSALIKEKGLAKTFDILRKFYPPRREFAQRRIVKIALSDASKKLLTGAGFVLD